MVVLILTTCTQFSLSMSIGRIFWRRELYSVLELQFFLFIWNSYEILMRVNYARDVFVWVLIVVDGSTSVNDSLFSSYVNDSLFVLTPTTVCFVLTSTTVGFVLTSTTVGFVLTSTTVCFVFTSTTVCLVTNEWSKTNCAIG